MCSCVMIGASDLTTLRSTAFRKHENSCAITVGESRRCGWRTSSHRGSLRLSTTRPMLHAEEVEGGVDDEEGATDDDQE
jgi:hypothetical protein